MNTKWKSLIHQLRTDKKGVVAIIVGLGLSAIAGMVGLVAQETIIYRTQSALQSSANIAALAGAQSINNPSGTAIATATTYSAVTGSDNAMSGQTVTMASGYPKLKCLTSTGVSCSGTDAANAIVVKQQATVPLIFGKLFGKSTLTLTATATAGAGLGGGSGYGARDIMLIVDTTQSMSNTLDSTCGISGAYRITCALAGARALLQALPPSSIHVGLMIFPGTTTSTEAALDYDCSSSTAPTAAAYNASPLTYQIVGLSSDYKTSDTATSLNTSSNLVIALGGGASGCTAGLSVVGGSGTYYAGVIAAAEAALTTNGRTGVQKAIVLLSDGAANATSSKVPSGMASNQCQEAITAAAAATTAGTWVYSAAYGSSTATGSSSLCTTDSSGISACATMQDIASTPRMFFSDTSGGSTSCTSTVNASGTNLVTVFQALGTSLSPPRLLPNTTT
jgi:hypothetical protein